LRKIPFASNLQIKVGLLFLLVALIPLAIVGTFSIKTAEDLILNMVSNQLENVATDKVALLARWISERRVDLQVVAGSSILKSMDPEQITPYLELVRKKYGVYEGFSAISRDGRIVVNTPGDKTIDTQEEWYRQSMAGKEYLSRISFDADLKQSVFRVSAPVVGDKDKVEGVVCATVGTRTILSIILRVSLGETGECYLVNSNGTFLAHKEPRRILTENIAQSESFKNIFGSPGRRRIYSDYRGVEVLGASRRVADTDWYLVVEQDRDEAFSSADRLRRYVCVVLGFSACGAMIVVWLLSFYIVHPIRVLSEAANTLAGGEFQAAAVKTNRTDEIGALYHAFQHMSNRLQKRQLGLKEKADLTEEELRETDVRLKKTELAAARSERLAALGRLAAGVTHEIRTPLTSLKLFLESVRGEIEISLEYQEDFQIAMHQIKRIEATINRFLDFAKPQEPIFSTIDAAKLIEDAMLLIKPKANHQQVGLKVMIDDDLPRMRGDKKQLGEVLLNLMVNALETMASRGVLTISAFMDRYESGGKPLECVRIDVSDTGPGIKEKNLSMLFDPFFTTKASGSGLGLSIVQETVSNHGGGIKVQSSEGEGTTFSVFLPYIKAHQINEYGKDIDS
jgi:two-component system NtrC family sensor kinase